MAADNSTGYHPLTANECRYLKEGFLADAQCPGLRLVANKTGQKRWVYRRQVDGKLKQETFGYYPKLSLTEAREKWQDLRGKRNRGEVITEGPVYTVKALCSDYIKGYAQRLKRSWKEDERQLWLDIVPVWGERQASTITRAEVISLHRGTWLPVATGWPCSCWRSVARSGTTPCPGITTSSAIPLPG